MHKVFKGKFFNKPANVNTEELIEKGKFYYDAGCYKDALAQFAQLIRHDKVHPDGYLWSAMTKLQIGALSSGLKDIEACITLGHCKIDIYYTQGVLQYSLGLYDEAVKSYSQVLQQDGKHVLSYINRALATSDITKAKEDFEKALEFASQISDKIAALNNRAVFYISQSDYKSAESDLQALQCLQPRNPLVYTQLGTLAQKQGQTEKAIEYFNQALNLDNRHIEAYIGKGVSYYRLKNTEVAQQLFQEALKLNPESIEAHYNLGVTLRKINRYQEAFEHFSKALSLTAKMESEAQSVGQCNKDKIQGITKKLGSGVKDIAENCGPILIQVGALSIKAVATAAAWGADAAAPGAGTAIGPAVECMGGICQLGVMIYNQINTARANKAQCKRLANRIIIVCDSVIDLDVTKNVDHYVLALNQLNETLRACHQLVEKFISKTWFQRVLVSGTDKDEFERINKELRVAISQLQLGLTAQQLFNTEEDRKDQEEDMQALKANMQTIIALNQEVKNDMQELKMEECERHEVLMQQLQSLEQTFMRALENKVADEYGSLPIYPFHKLQIDAKLDKHALGKMYLGRLHNEAVVLKEIVGVETETAREQFLREAKIMDRLRSRHFSLFYGICFEENRHYLLMEYLPKGKLLDYLSENSALSFKKRHEMIMELAKGLDFLHDSEVYLRGLTSASIGIDSDDHAKIMDFSVAKVQVEIAKTVNKIVEERGSLRYLPPERIVRTGIILHDKEDIYRFGLIILEILTGRQICHDLPDVACVQKILTGELVDIPDYIPEFYQKLISDCTQEKPFDRLDIKSLIKQLEAYTLPDADKLNEQGMKYEKGDDIPKAYAYYEQAAYCGSKSARTNLGTLLCAGKGMEYDYERAFELFTLSAKENHTRAMVNLARLYEKGLGTEQDITKAKELLKKAANHGDKIAAKRLAELDQPQAGDLYQSKAAGYKR